MNNEDPPFQITTSILSLSQQIYRELGVLAGAKIEVPPIKLRRLSSIVTIQASLAIEGNTLSLDQVTALLDGKRVIGPEKDILEANNAIKAYKDLNIFNPLSIKDLLLAHRILMESLVEVPGSFRSGSVGIAKEGAITHVAPPADRVPHLMRSLFNFLAAKNELSWLIKASVFHYELEFIHPFSDGNGRIGRLWQQLILIQEDPVFAFIPIEAIIRQNQAEYYKVLAECDRQGNATLFIEFSLKQILDALQKYSLEATPTVHDADSRLQFAKNKIVKHWFARVDYMNIHKEISSASASRDLAHGVVSGLLQKRGEKNQVRYRFV
ncbi:MAG: Fic family protein [Verrucomicrobia bacterium]|nr:Fic family protein [Verrucomicrobiota bacterium]